MKSYAQYCLWDCQLHRHLHLEQKPDGSPPGMPFPDHLERSPPGATAVTDNNGNGNWLLRISSCFARWSATRHLILHVRASLRLARNLSPHCLQVSNEERSRRRGLTHRPFSSITTPAGPNLLLPGNRLAPQWTSHNKNPLRGFEFVSGIPGESFNSVLGLTLEVPLGYAPQSVFQGSGPCT